MVIIVVSTTSPQEQFVAFKMNDNDMFLTYRLISSISREKI